VTASPPRRATTLWMIAPLLLAAAVLRVELLCFGIAVVCAWFLAGRWMHIDAHSAPGGRAVRGTGMRSTVVLVALVAAALALLFTGVIPDRHRWILTRAPDFLVGGVLKLPYLPSTLTAVLIDTPGNQAPVIANVWRYVMAAACLAAWAPRLRAPRAEAAVLFSALAVVFNFSLYLILRPEPYISLHGFLPIAPLIVLAAYVLSPVRRQRRYRQLAITIAGGVSAVLGLAAILIFQVSSAGALPTGLEWGNRYLFTLYPIGTVLALGGLYEYRRSARPVWLKRAVIGVAAALLVCGALLQARGVWMLVESRRLVTTWQAELRGGPPVVTDVWWLPAAMAPLFMSHEVQCVRQADDLEEWVAAAAQHGVDSVVFASFRGLNDAALRPAGFEVSTVDERVISGLRLTRLRFVPTAHDS
jgi:hypothetical protein